MAGTLAKIFTLPLLKEQKTEQTKPEAVTPPSAPTGNVGIGATVDVTVTRGKGGGGGGGGGGETTGGLNTSEGAVLVTPEGIPVASANLPPSTETPAQATARNAAGLLQLKKEAGTFGKNLGLAKETGFLQGYISEQNKKTLADQIPFITDIPQQTIPSEGTPLQISELKPINFYNVITLLKKEAVDTILNNAAYYGKQEIPGLKERQFISENPDYIFDINQPKGIKGFNAVNLETGVSKEFGGGTVTVNNRVKNFFEKNNLNITDNDAIKLKTSVDNIQSRFESNKITEDQANKELNKAQDSYVKAKLIEGAVKNIAYGAAYTILTPDKVRGISDVALGGLQLLNAEETFAQAQKFPFESALNTAGFIAGGLIGTGLKGGSAKIKIDLSNIEKTNVKPILGKVKTKLINKFAEYDLPFAAELKAGKITSTIMYDIITKDTGKLYRVLEFTKAQGGLEEKSIGGKKGFIALEINPKIKGVSALSGKLIRERLEVLAGKGLFNLKAGETQTYISVIKGQPATTKLGRGFQKIFGIKGGVVLNIAEISRGHVKGNILAQKSRINSVAVILKAKRLNKTLGREILRLEEKYAKNKTIHLNDFRRLVNLERKKNGLDLFSIAEFQKAGLKNISQIDIVSFLDKLKKSEQATSLKLSQIVTEKRNIKGFGKSEPVKTIPKISAGIKRTSKPFEFTKEEKLTAKKIMSLGQKERQLLINKPVKIKAPLTISQFAQRIEEVNKSRLKSETGLKISPSVAAISLAIGAKIKAPPRFNYRPITRLGLAKSPSTKKVKTSLILKPVIKNRTIEKQEQALKNSMRFKERQITVQKQFQGQKNRLIQATEPFTIERTEQLQRLNLKLQLKQQQLQQQRLRTPQRTVQISKTSFKPKSKISPPVPFTTFTEFVGGPVKEKIKLRKKEGYITFYKKGKAFIKINRKPLTKSEALDLGSQVADRSLANTYKIKRVFQKPQPPELNIQKGYFARTQKKFRDYRIIRGNRVPLKDTFIEKRGPPRIDTITEKQKLQAAAYIARLRKQSFVYPTNKVIRKSVV